MAPSNAPCQLEHNSPSTRHWKLVTLQNNKIANKPGFDVRHHSNSRNYRRYNYRVHPHFVNRQWSSRWCWHYIHCPVAVQTLPWWHATWYLRCKSSWDCPVVFLFESTPTPNRWCPTQNVPKWPSHPPAGELHIEHRYMRYRHTLSLLSSIRLLYVSVNRNIKKFTFNKS